MRSRPCDKRVKTGRRYGKMCTAPATHYDPHEMRNLCGQHRQDAYGALRGVGTPWYADREFGCDTAGHEHRPLRRIVDERRLCLECSGTYALAVELHADEVSA